MSDLAERRQQVVRDHMALEVTHDWDAVIATFDHPRYEMYGSGAVFDGEEAVRRYFAASRTPFPDQWQRDHRHIAFGKYGAGRVLADRHASRAAGAGRQDNSANWPQIPRAHGGEFRVQAGKRPHSLRAAVFRSGRGAARAGSGLAARGAVGLVEQVCQRRAGQGIHGLHPDGRPRMISAASDQRRTLESAARWKASRM